MKALSIRSPWWWFILHAGKDIENRDWFTQFRGTVLIHASKWWVNNDAMDDIMAALSCCGKRRAEVTRSLSIDGLRDCRGCLVGTVRIEGCVTRSESPWFFGDYGFVLRNPEPLPHPIPFKGALGFFDVPDDLILAGRLNHER